MIAANFVGSFERNNYVYFFFHETATEYLGCVQPTYSTVARVCKVRGRGGVGWYRKGGEGWCGEVVGEGAGRGGVDVRWDGVGCSRGGRAERDGWRSL